ncbi:MAG: putative transporter transrane protein [Myxococcaceae bacterium]|nr:putative transporter transrane protein [Myxococcaceae bacterium]
MSALRIYRQGLLVGYRDFRDMWSLRSWFFGWMLRILTNAFAWVLLGRVVGSETRVQYLLVGNALAAGAAAALWASNATTWSRLDGSHPLLVIAPSGLLPVVIGRTSIWLSNGVATSLVSFAVLLGAFGYRPSLLGVFLLPVVIVVVCWATFCFALFMGALLNSRPRYRNIALDIAGMLMLAICGASVPVSFWPAPIQLIAEVLPLTHGLVAARLLFTSADLAAIVRPLTLELLVGGCWLGLSLVAVTRLFNGGRADGSIELT